MAFPESLLLVSGRMINVTCINYVIEIRPFDLTVHFPGGTLTLKEAEAARGFIEFLGILRDPNVQGSFVRFGIYLVNLRRLVTLKEDSRGVRIRFPNEVLMISQQKLYPDDRELRLIDQFPGWRRFLYGEQE